LALPCVRGVDVVVLLWLLALMLLALVLLGAGGDVGILFGEDGYDAGGDFVVDDRLVVLSHDVDSEFLYQHERRDNAEGMG
jgi:hypothetical protein